jgi:DNA polymerase III epsilon subunit-like protein
MQGRSHNAPMPPLRCVIDIEASGFGRGSYPIEVGWVLADGSARCFLVRPAPHWTHWDEAAERVHGITRSALAAHGRPPRSVAEQLNADLAGGVAYCDGWAHDYPWLAALFDEAELVPAFKLDAAARLLDAAALDRLGPARDAARHEMGVQRHRASNDARALQRALQRLEAGARAGPT